MSLVKIMKTPHKNTEKEPNSSMVEMPQNGQYNQELQLANKHVKNVYFTIISKQKTVR